jgi:hypothetical protein
MVGLIAALAIGIALVSGIISTLYVFTKIYLDAET